MSRSTSLRYKALSTMFRVIKVNKMLDKQGSELNALLEEYLISKGYTDIKLLYGASLGVAVAYRLFTDKDFNIEKAWFDGVALNKNAAFA